MVRKDHRKKIIISGVFGILAAIIILGVYFICDYYNSTKKTVTILSEYNHYTATVYGDADVADALSQAGITLRPSDKVYTPLSQKVNDNDVIYIKYEESSEEYVSASSIADTSTYVIPNIIDTPAGNFYYYYQIQVEASAYCSCEICCAPYDGSTTASGTTPRANHTIAASASYDFGTTVYIPYFSSSSNSGIFVVEDRGGAIQGNRIDIYYSTHQEALEFGRRTLTMYVLDTDISGI